MIKKPSNKTSNLSKLVDSQKDKFLEYQKFQFSWHYLEKPFLEKLIKPLNKSTTKILDAGCGNGRGIEYLVNKGFKDENIVGIDISSELLKECNIKFPKVRTYKTDLIKFNSKIKFDLIISIHVLVYLNNKDLKKSLINLRKHLKSNGKLFLIIAHPVWVTRNNLKEYFKRDWIDTKTPWGTSFPQYLSPLSDIFNVITESGMKIVRVEEPEVPVIAKKKDKDDYEKYTSCPSRLVITAIKD